MLGSHIVEQLARAGWRVCALTRDPVAAAWLNPLGAECVRGDVTDAASVRAASSGCDLIFHSAAVIGPSATWEPYRRTNVEGTANVIDAAAATGARLVHVSSTAVYGGEARYHSARVDESVRLPPPIMHDHYARSKRESEDLVFAANAEGRVWATAVRPPPMYGLRDRQFVPRLAPVLERGFFPLIAGGRSILCAVYAGNAAEGAMLAAGADVARGRAYNLTNDVDVTVREFIHFAATGLGRRVRTPMIPYGVARVGAGGVAGITRIVGRPDLALRAHGAFHLLTRDNPFTSDRARRELGWVPSVPASTAIPESFRWWKARRA
jgi:nucleoside-diphosphate-sugar epimerase